MAGRPGIALAKRQHQNKLPQKGGTSTFNLKLCTYISIQVRTGDLSVSYSRVENLTRRTFRIFAPSPCPRAMVACSVFAFLLWVLIVPYHKPPARFIKMDANGVEVSSLQIPKQNGENDCEDLFDVGGSHHG